MQITKTNIGYKLMLSWDEISHHLPLEFSLFQADLGDYYLRNGKFIINNNDGELLFCKGEDVWNYNPEARRWIKTINTI